MMSVDVDENLREQSKLLLRKLKDRQGKLQNIVQISNVSCTTGASSVPKMTDNNVQSSTNVKEMFDTSLKKTVGNPCKEGKEKLQKLTKTAKRDENQNNNRLSDKENLNEMCCQKLLKSKEVDMRSASPISRENNIDMSIASEKTALKDLRAEIDSLSNAQDKNENFAKSMETPNTVRRRRIIDKNIRVGGTVNLNESEIMRECEEEFPRLNFSYSNVDDADLHYLQSKLSPNTEPKVIHDEIPTRDTDQQETEAKGYSDRLENPGNSRKIAKLIRESGKPKSILLSTSQRQNKVKLELTAIALYLLCPHNFKEVEGSIYMDIGLACPLVRLCITLFGACETREWLMLGT